MRELRQEARDLTKQEDEIGHRLDSLSNGEHQTLDNSAERRQIVEQMEKRQNTLTNLLAQMRDLTEQTEATEPLLSKQLYDSLRRADQMQAENLLQMGAELTARGFLPEANQVEQTTRTNLTELARSIDRAADSVLGSEADALRYAQKQLDDLTRQVERDAAGAGTNTVGQARETSDGGDAHSNHLETADGRAERAAAEPSTNSTTPASGSSPLAQGRIPTPAGTGARASADHLRQLALQLGAAGGNGGVGENGPITGNDYVSWADHLREVEQVVDPEDLRNQLATVRERAAALRADYREHGRKPDPNVVRQQIVTPLTQVRAWLQEELARRENTESLVPLDRDPVPDHYAELVKEYYERLGSAP
jgi:hypothetical protein